MMLKATRDNLSEFIGIPYVAGASSYRGADCWGLVRMYFRDVEGVLLPDYGNTGARCEVDEAVIAREMDEKGYYVETDGIPAIAVFSTDGSAGVRNHVGVMFEPGRVLHASAGRNSCVVSLSASGYWARRLRGLYRYKPGAGTR